jgi:hypothetical protein
MCICLCMCVCVGVSVYECVHACVSTCMCACLRACMQACMRVGMFEFKFAYSLLSHGQKITKPLMIPGQSSAVDEPLLTIKSCARDTKNCSFSMSTTDIPSQSTRRK